MSPRHIALYLGNLRAGGAERVMLNLAEGLVGRGQRVTLVVTTADGELRDQVPDRVVVRSLGAGRTRNSLGPLRRFLREQSPEVLVTASLHGAVLVLLARLLERAPAKIVVTVHSTLSTLIAERRKERLLMRWGGGLVRRLLRRADAVVAVSRGVGEDFAETFRWSPERIRVIYNPVVAERPADPRQQGRPNDDADPFVLGVGRLSVEKDFETLVRGFARLAKDAPELRLVILGEGPERSTLEALIRRLRLEERVEMPGYVADPSIYMRDARLLALTSRREGLPTVLIEALAEGCPIVSTDCPHGPREILADGSYGRLVPVGADEALAEAMRETMANPPEPALLMKRARDFSYAAAQDAYLALFDELTLPG